MTSRALIDLIAREAYEEGSFILASGEKSDFYLDVKRVTYSSAGVELVGSEVLKIANEFEVEAIGGLTLGADAIVISTVHASLKSPTPLHGFSVRKDTKEHGKRKTIEGVSPAGKRVAVVDDVITRGGSVLNAVAGARAEGAEVVVVIGLVDREEGGRAAVEAAGVPFRAVCTLSEIRARLAEVTASR